MIKNEIKLISKNKGLIGALLIVLIIPFFYSYCFLTSAWDPYGNTGKIPVAVVNLDQPAELQGTKIQAGADTVAKLKDDDQLKWDFVTKEQAAKGLKENKYYSVVTFPADFSKNAATVLDANPKKMELQYETNGSLNYISEVITQVGVDKLNAQIREKLTAAFSSELFSQIASIGDQIKTAADGATQISDGEKTLQTGLTKYTDGVKQVDDGLTTLYGSVPALTSGVTQLSDGGNQLKNGLTQLNGKVPTLSSGVNQLNAGMNSLYSAVTKNNSSGQNLATGISALKEGIDQLDFYTLAERNGNPNMVDGVDQMATKMAKLLATVQKQLSLIKTAQMKLNIGMTPEKLGATVPANLVQADGKVYPLYHFKAAQDKASAATDTGLKKVEDSLAATQSQTDLDKLKETVAASTDQATKDALAAYLTSHDAEKTATQASVDELHQEVDAENATQDGVFDGSINMLKFVESNLSNTGTDAEGDPTGLITAVTMFSEKLTTLNNELSNAAVSGHPTYKDAVSQIKNGLGQLNAAVNNPDPSQNLVGGITQLKNGMNQLAANVPALSSGVKQLYDGSVLESNGLNELNSKTPALADGVKQLHDGTTQLVANNSALNDGTKKLVDGSQQLSTGLSEGYEKIAATHLTEMTAEMFAAPTKTVQSRLTTVKNYGAALAPFVLALALFIAIVIFNFAYPMKRKATDDERSPFAWLLGKLAVGTAVAVGMGVIEAILMMVVGLQVNHVGAFFGVTLLFALAAMYLTMFLNIVFGRLGIFMALGLLTLSGSGGLFPQETVSPLYISLQKFLPMTYAINGYRQAISSGIASQTVTMSLAILIGIIVVSLALLALFIGLTGHPKKTPTQA